MPIFTIKTASEMKIRNILNTFFLLLFVISVQAQSTTEKHVILIGIDGVSAEAFQYSNTTVMNSLISQGVLSLKTRGVMPTVSAPNWTSILSGAGPEQHGVTSNSWSLGSQGFEPTVKDADGYFTSIFTIIRKQMPKAVTAMFYDWESLSTYVNKKLISKEQYIQGHVMITSVALNYIKNEKPVFTFIYYGLPDETGHSKGFNTKAYYQSINEIDTEIGKIVAGLQEYKMWQNTTIIITSDHGGTGYRHGGESMLELEVPWIITGPGVKKNQLLETPNDNLNTAPTIARILALKPPPEWIGKPVSDAFASGSTKQKPNKYVPKPYCSLDDGAYPGPQQIVLSNTLEDVVIYYTLDGSIPGVSSRKYKSPFTISSNCTLKAIAVSGSGSSQVITRTFTFVQGIRTATLTTQPGDTYPGSGVSGLFDGLIGSSNHTNKQWMGFEGVDFEVTIDLGEKKEIKALGLDVLKLHANRIFLPASIEFYSSTDGENYSLINTYFPAEPDDLMPDGPVMLSRNFDNLRSQYIRIKAVNMGVCPKGDPNEGQKAWLFVSEVEIE